MPIMLALAFLIRILKKVRINPQWPKSQEHVYAQMMDNNVLPAGNRNFADSQYFVSRGRYFFAQ